MKILQSLALTVIVFLLSSCGGGGGGGSSNSTGNITYTILQLDAAPSQTNIALKASDYYKVDVQAGYVLTFTLKTLSGDADIALFSAEPPSQSTLISFSANTGTTDEIINYTATRTGTLYIEVGGFLASTYTIQVTTAGSIGSTPVISANPPARVNEGGQFSFQVLAHIPNNPAANFTYQVLYGPSGMSVDALGNVNWTAHGAIFSTSVDVNYAIRANSGGSSADYTGKVTVNDPAQALPLLRGGLTAPRRESGFITADFDNDGSDEVLVTNHHKHVYLLEESGGIYGQSWMQPIDLTLDGVVGSISAGELNGDNYPEIIIGSSRSTLAGDLAVARISIIDGRNRTLRLDAPAGPNAFTVYGMEVLDADNDGQAEIVALVQNFSSAGQFYINILDAGTLAMEWQSPAISGQYFATGNLDADPYPEIATNDGYVYAYNGSSYVQKWNYGGIFGRRIAIADLDADGTDEIISDTDIYSLVTTSVRWSLPNNGWRYVALQTANLDSESGAEIIVGEEQFGDVVIFDYNSSSDQITEITRTSNQGHGISSFGVGQLDVDPDPEIIWSTDVSTTGRDHLIVSSFTGTISHDWDNASIPILDTPFFGAQMATLAPGDRRAMFILARTSEGREGTRIVALSPGGDTSINSADLGNGWANAVALAVNDYDADSVDEILFASSAGYNGFLSAFDFLAEMTEWTSAPDIGTSRLLAMLDVNNDLVPDLVTFDSDSELEVHDVLNGSLLTTISLPAVFFHDMQVLNMDADPDEEVLLVHGSTVYVYGLNGTGGLQLEQSMPLSLDSAISTDTIAMDAGDLDGDTRPEVTLVNSGSGGTELIVLDNNLNQLSSSRINADVSNVVIEPYSGGRRNVILAMHRGFVNHDRAWLAWADPMTGTLIAESSNLVGVIQKNSLNVTDLNGDSQPDFIIGTEDGMYLSQ